ncbi:Atg3p [Sporobolomyces koalae]|uniref:Atg3p n=1 Tax=Sporobolomyces koalae TaxID=500713 RepID=UPI003173513D
MLGSIQTHFWAVRDYLSPVLRDSKFKETGRLTPEEFVAAGDFLSYKFPTWTWEAGHATKRREFLRADKQYLISRNVPCLRRVSQLGQQQHTAGGPEEYTEMMMNFASEQDGAAEDEWVATHANSIDSKGAESTDIPTIGEIPDLDGSHTTNSLEHGMGNVSIDDANDIPDMDEIPDMDDDLQGQEFGLVQPEGEEDDDAAVNVGPSDYSTGADSNLVQIRTYDCMITYDKYYQTPRMWLLGYDEQKRPLPPQSALSDVSSDHAMKTVTIEPFPHSPSLSIASVHPCKHSNVMKTFIERMDRNVKQLQQQQQQQERSSSSRVDKVEGGSGDVKKGGSRWFSGSSSKSSIKKEEAAAVSGEETVVEGLRVDQYLVVFLKFMSSIVPTIEVDSTTNI